MATGVRIVVTDRATSKTSVHSFSAFPVRIGRNPLNDLQLSQTFVSQFHALVDLQDSALILRDLGSTNGVAVNGQAVDPSGSVVLGDRSSVEILLLQLEFERAELGLRPGAPASRRLRATTLIDMALPAAVKSPDAVVDQALRAQGPRYESYHAALRALIRSLETSLLQLPGTSRDDFIKRVAAQYPSLVNEPEFQRLAHGVGASLPGISGSPSRPVEALAWAGLKEIGEEYVGRDLPENVEQVSNLLGKLKATLDVFFDSYVPLRDGHRQLESEIAISRGSAVKTGARLAVERATTPQQVAARLLDWSTSDTEGTKAVSDTFADLMIHQVVMLNAIVSGVRALLRELEPAAIEAEARGTRSRLARFWPAAHASHLWRLYVRRHGDVSEDQEIFRRVFGALADTLAKHLAAARSGPRPALQAGINTAPAPRANVPEPQERHSSG